jgi:hypothetical protein
MFSKYLGIQLNTLALKWARLCILGFDLRLVNLLGLPLTTKRFMLY